MLSVHPLLLTDASLHSGYLTLLTAAGYDLYAVLPNTNAPFRPRDVYRASFPRGTEKVDQDGGLDNCRMTVTRENARHEIIKSSLFSSAKTRAKGTHFHILALDSRVWNYSTEEHTRKWEGLWKFKLLW